VPTSITVEDERHNSTVSERVTIEVSDGIADVRLNRPEKRNALDREMFRAIADAGEVLKATRDLRAVVLSGEGKSFCAGLDLSLFADLDAPAERGDPATLQPGGMTHLGQQVAWVWQELPVPVIAAVHGHALGGGLQIALGADIRIAHPDTQLSVREVHWGLVPDMTGTLALSRLVGPDVAKELTFTARIFDGREGARLGLVTRLSDEPHSDAAALAAEIAANDVHAVQASKRLFNRLANAGAGEQFAAERTEIAALVRQLADRAP
jgi:enoyl-CoA hydratase/carnithine racemase